MPFHRFRRTILITSLVWASGAFAASQSHADERANLTALLQSYYSQASAASKVNAAFAAYKFAAPYVNSGQSWRQVVIDNVTATQVLKVAGMRCEQNTTQEVAKFAAVLGASFNPAQYNAAKTQLCKVIQVAAELKARYDAYLALKENGYPLVYKENSHRHSFPQGRHRTIAGGFELRYFPDIMDTATNGFTVEDRFQYNSWIKFSDNERRPLNIIKRIRESQGSNEDMICMPVISNWAHMCVSILNISTSALDMKAYAKVRRFNRTKTVSLGSFTVPAPFGYLDEVAQMKDRAKQDLMNAAMKQVSNVLNIDSQMMQTLQKAYQMYTAASGR